MVFIVVNYSITSPLFYLDFYNVSATLSDCWWLAAEDDGWSGLMSGFQPDLLFIIVFFDGLKFIIGVESEQVETIQIFGKR